MCCPIKIDLIEFLSCDLARMPNTLLGIQVYEERELLWKIFSRPVLLKLVNILLDCSVFLMVFSSA